MNKKILMLMSTMILVFGVSMNVYAEQTVTLTSNSKLIYQDDKEYLSKISLGDEFNLIAPGETRTQTITLKNENDYTAKFYVSAKVMESAKEEMRLQNNKIDSEESKGKFFISLSVNSNSPFYKTDQEVTKYNGNLGFVLGQDLKNDKYVVTLKKNESADLILSIGLDGESVGNYYQDSIGNIEFMFSATYDTPTKTETVESDPDEMNVTYLKAKVANTVAAIKTGDTSPIIALSSILVIGILLLFLTGKKKKRLENIS